MGYRRNTVVGPHPIFEVKAPSKPPRREEQAEPLPRPPKAIRREPTPQRQDWRDQLRAIREKLNGGGR